MVSFPPYRLDLVEERLWQGSKQLALRRKPFAILRYLVTNPKKLVTHEELLAQIWRGAVVSESAVRSHLHELRTVLGDGVIETVIGRGYRFMAELADDDVPRSTPEVMPVDPLVVGRDPELATLRAALERAREGRRQLCFVTGKPGIGKSTLVRTFLAGLDPSSVVVGRGHCFEQHGTAEPYLAVIEALGALTRSVRGPQLLATLIRYAPTFLSRVPHLITDDQLVEVTRRAAGGNEAKMLRELSEAIEAMCSQEPLVLVLEDLQWSDVATIDLLSLLGQRQERAKLLVIGTSRHAEIQSTEHPLNHVMRSLVTRSGAISLQVPKVEVAAVQSFIDRRFAGHEFPERLTDVVARISGGTPVFMVALLDELAGRGMLAERDGRWTLTVSLDVVESHRPASVKQLIDIQLDRLTATEQRVLEAASIIGAEFSTILVAAALELSVEQVDEACDSLARRALFLRAEPDDRYGVRHALVQEVCLERSSPARRQRWNRLVAEALERDPLAVEVSHLLAKHFDAGGDPTRAIPAYAAAARQAGQRFASSDAVALCARALELLPRMPASRERDVLELEILWTMCRQVSSRWFAAFAGREPLAVYARAIEIARSLGDASGLYAALTQLCNYHLMTAHYDRSTELTAELERIEQTHTLDPALLHSGVFARGYIAFYRGDFPTALRLFESLCSDRTNLAGTALALGHLACVRWLIGEPDRALAEASETIDFAERAKVPALNALGHVVRGRLRYLRRDPVAIREEEAPLAIAAASIDLGMVDEAIAFALWAQAERAPLALAAITPAVEVIRGRLTGIATGCTLVALTLIDVLRISNHTEEARRLTDEIIEFATTHNESAYLPELIRVRGEQRQDPDAAARDFREAIALAQSMGARSLEQRATASLAARRA